MAGEVFGSYRVVDEIGRRGMGAVFLAEHTLLGRQAAIKVLLREMSHRQDLVARFFNEARAATAVKHPGIVEIFDFGYAADGSAYIVMEFLERESLASRLRRRRPFPEARAACPAGQTCGDDRRCHGPARSTAGREPRRPSSSASAMPRDRQCACRIREGSGASMTSIRWRIEWRPGNVD